MMMLPLPLFKADPIWQAVQFPSPGALVNEGDGPDADAKAMRRGEVMVMAATSMTKTPMAASFAPLDLIVIKRLAAHFCF
jgi:hypothetical protein